MSNNIKINSVSPHIVPPFAICSDNGNDFVINTHGKYPVNVSRDGNVLTIKDIDAPLT